MEGKCQTMDAVYHYLHHSCEKSALDWQKENGRESIIIIKSHSTTNDIHMRRYFQVMFGKKILD